MGQLKRLKIGNIKLVLDTLRKNNHCSKKYISSITGLSSTLLTNICNELKLKSLITEGDFVNSEKPGRREVQMDLNYQFKKVIGINISNTYCEIVISDLKPNLLFQTKFSTNLHKNELFLKKILDTLYEYLNSNKLTWNDFIGIGITSKGTIDSLKGVVGFDFFDEELPIKEYLGKNTNLPIFIENDVKALSLTQNFFYPEYNDFFLVKYSIHGIGGAIFKDGHLYVNQDNIVGKIGHIIMDPTQDYCPICKRRGCLESIISITQITNCIKELFYANKLPILKKILKNDFSNFNIPSLFEASDCGSIEINKILQKSASLMAQALINTYVIVGSNKIILYGDFFTYSRYMFLLESYIKKYQLTNFWDKISLSSLNNTQESLASCVLVINNIFNIHFEEYYNSFILS